MPPKYFKEPVLTLDELLKDLKEMTFYCYKINGRIVGVAALKVKTDKIGQIRWVYILSEHQRKGVGTALISHIEDEALKLRLVKLSVLTNENAYWARNFYQKLDYKIIDQIPRPWGDDIVYEKILI